MLGSCAQRQWQRALNIIVADNDGLRGTVPRPSLRLLGCWVVVCRQREIFGDGICNPRSCATGVFVLRNVVLELMMYEVLTSLVSSVAGP